MQIVRGTPFLVCFRFRSYVLEVSTTSSFEIYCGVAEYSITGNPMSPYLRSPCEACKHSVWFKTVFIGCARAKSEEDAVYEPVEEECDRFELFIERPRDEVSVPPSVRLSTKRAASRL